MTDRAESLLAELVDLQRQQLANQQEMLRRQEVAAETSRQSIERTRKAMSRLWLIVLVVIVLMLVPPILNWISRAGR